MNHAIKSSASLPRASSPTNIRFYPSGRTSSHVRTSFSLVDLEVDADLGFQRLAEAIQDKRKMLGLA